MSYRDDRDADQLRIDALEQELARARQRIDELEGKRAHALVVQPGGALALTSEGKVARWFGAPGQLHLTRRWDAAFPTDHFEELIEVIREVTRDPGRSELLKSSLTWYPSRTDKQGGPSRVLAISVRDGATTLTATERLGPLGGAIFGGIGGGVGGGGIMVPILATTAVPVLAPVFFLGWFGGVFLGARGIFKRAARRRAIALQAVFDAIAQQIERRLPPTP